MQSNGPNFQRQIDDLKAEQVEQGIEQRRQGQDQDVQSRRNYPDWIVYVTVAILFLLVGLALGIVLDEWAGYSGWFGWTCYWGLPCSQR